MAKQTSLRTELKRQKKLTDDWYKQAQDSRRANLTLASDLEEASKEVERLEKQAVQQRCVIDALISFVRLLKERAGIHY